jgi:hypothetical protein
MGRPIKVMDKRGLWLDVPVKLDVEPFRFGGTGYIPFHIDVVNSTKPPDVVGFFCERPDPLGGGATIISNLLKGVKTLTPDEVEFLSQPNFRDGKLVDMSEVGAELNPFPVLARKSDGTCAIRFTAKMLHGMPDGDSKRLMQKLERILVENQEVFELEPGQLLLMNQNIVAHGRTPLGPDQGSVSVSKRRLLHQIYMRIETAR